MTGNEKTVISLFLIFFLGVVCVWLLDDDYLAAIKGPITEYSKPAMGSLGWVQYWGVFAPELRNQNYHTTAVIDFEDGTSKLYEFPNTNINQKDYFSHFGGEKKRKLFNDNISWPNYEQFRPSVARFLARANDDPANPPQTVTIYWHHAWTPPPDPKHWVYRDQLPQHTEQRINFLYSVDPNSLPSKKQQ
ncbi:MAG: hypothetical protein JST01_06375 [Cyanobacteria bacterium SZAS TMP-1]|nr:hypothetical protein [Cyanobacteria bacterium SZAS TMP-1]